MMHLVKLWLPVFIWAAGIYFFSGISDLSTGLEQDHLIRKFGHILEYLILFLLLYRALYRTSAAFQRSSVPFAAAATLLYAVSDEFHQSFVAGRTGSFIDVCIDSIGIGIGVLLIRFVFYKFGKT